MHRQVEESFKDNKDVVFFHVQTVFEGFRTNTPTNGLKVAQSLGVKTAILYDARIDSYRHSEIMRTYKTRGTPWTVVIDRSGKVAMSQFSPRTPDELSKTIKAALAVKVEDPKKEDPKK